jgi:hypothetical protein
MQGICKFLWLICLACLVTTVPANLYASYSDDLREQIASLFQTSTPTRSSTSNLHAVPDNNPDIVRATGRLVGYHCVPGGDPVVDARIKQNLQEEAVNNAESMCSWVNGRPNIERISEWEFRVECRTSSGATFGVGNAWATFRCNPR